MMASMECPLLTPSTALVRTQKCILTKPAVVHIYTETGTHNREMVVTFTAHCKKLVVDFTLPSIYASLSDILYITEAPSLFKSHHRRVLYTKSDRRARDILCVHHFSLYFVIRVKIGYVSKHIKLHTAASWI